MIANPPAPMDLAVLVETEKQPSRGQPSGTADAGGPAYWGSTEAQKLLWNWEFLPAGHLCVPTNELLWRACHYSVAGEECTAEADQQVIDEIQQDWRN